MEYLTNCTKTDRSMVWFLTDHLLFDVAGQRIQGNPRRKNKMWLLIQTLNPRRERRFFYLLKQSLSHWHPSSCLTVANIIIFIVLIEVFSGRIQENKILYYLLYWDIGLFPTMFGGYIQCLCNFFFKLSYVHPALNHTQLCMNRNR